MEEMILGWSCPHSRSREIAKDMPQISHHLVGLLELLHIVVVAEVL